jgi:hypothetical protein
VLDLYYALAGWTMSSEEAAMRDTFTNQSQPFLSARRAASTRLRVPSFLIAVER